MAVDPTNVLAGDTAAPPASPGLPAYQAPSVPNLSGYLDALGLNGNYGQQFQDSLNASRADLSNQYAGAMADVAKREGLANQALGQLPGRVNSLYDQGNASLAGYAGQLDAAQKASGLASFMPSSAQMAPFGAAMSMDRTSRLADVPLLQIGSQAQFNAQRSAFDRAKISALSALDQENRGYLQNMNSAKLNAAGSLMSALMNDESSYNQQLRQYQANGGMPDWMAQMNYQHQLDQETARQKLLNDAGLDMTPQEYDAVRNSGAYKMAQNMLNGNYYGVGSKFAWGPGSGGNAQGGLAHREATVTKKTLSLDEVKRIYKDNPQLLAVLSFEAGASGKK